MVKEHLIGTTRATTVVEGVVRAVSVGDAIFVKELKMNLLYVSFIRKKDLAVTCRCESKSSDLGLVHVVDKKSGKVVMNGFKRSYSLHKRVLFPVAGSKPAAKCYLRPKRPNWHTSLAHAPAMEIRQTVLLVDGLKNASEEPTSSCEIVLRNKSGRAENPLYIRQTEP